MKKYLDTISVEFTFSDIIIANKALIRHTDRCIEIKAPAQVIERYAQVAKKLNDILEQNEFNYYTDKKFQEYEEYIKQYYMNNRDCE